MQLAFIGSGQMARALGQGFLAAKLIGVEQLAASDPSSAARDEFSQLLGGCATFERGVDAIAGRDVIFVAVKPQHVPSVFDDIGPTIASQPQSPLVVSIVAGIPLAQLTAGLQTDRVIRVMPNTPALVGAGASGFSATATVSHDDKQLVQQLLSSVGMAFELPESMLDAVTGLSGSGPAFAYQMIEAMSDGGVRVGLPREVATRLAAQTLLGAAQMVLQTGEHPGLLKDRVTSPGGTTIAGIHALEAGGLRATLMNAVVAATERSRALGSS